MGLKTSALIVVGLLGVGNLGRAAPFSFSYGGRLADDTGVAIAGPVDLALKFYASATGGSPLPVSAVTFSGVNLDDGVFQVDVTQLVPAELNTVFSGSGDTWVEVTDTTHNVTYPRQRMSAVPFALKVPVDGKALSYDGNGNLTLAAGAGTSGQTLVSNGNGTFTWSTPSSSGPSGPLTVASIPALPASKITSGTLAASLLPPLPASALTGTLAPAQLPPITASQLTAGTLAVAVVPPLPASKITSGTLSAAQLPLLTVPQGGTGTTSLTSNALLVGQGTSTVNFLSPGTNGQVVMSDGTSWHAVNPPKPDFFFVTSSDHLTATNGTWTQVPGMSATFTLAGTAKVRLQLTGAEGCQSGSTSTATCVGAYRFKIDGVGQGTTWGNFFSNMQQYGNYSGIRTFTVSQSLSSLAAGSHTITVEVTTNADGTSSQPLDACGAGGYANDYTRCTLDIMAFY